MIDTLCVARLSWDANREADFRGYRILRSFTEEEEEDAALNIRCVDEKKGTDHCT